MVRTELSVQSPPLVGIIPCAAVLSLLFAGCGELPRDPGHSFAPADSDKTEPVVLVNESLVQRYFSQNDPIGKRIRPAAGDFRNGPWFRIIGVVGDEKRTTVYQEMAWVGAPTFYRSLNQSTESGANLLVRVRDSNAPRLRSSIERAIANIDSEIPLDNIQSVPASKRGPQRTRVFAP